MWVLPFTNAKEEGICYHSVPCLDKLKEMEGKPMTCITDHPGFINACTNFWAPETAWYHKRQYNYTYEGSKHKQYHYVTFRQFLYWVFILLDM